MDEAQDLAATLLENYRHEAEQNLEHSRLREMELLTTLAECRDRIFHYTAEINSYENALATLRSVETTRKED